MYRVPFPAVIYTPSLNDGGRRVYVTLPSNSSSAYYPDNTLSDFTTKLFKPIDLTGEWEVALTEISFPHSFYNITEPFNRILYSGNGSTRKVKTFNIPSGYYHDLKELFLTMHEMMDELGQRNIKLTLNKNTQKVKVKLDGGAFIDFRAELAAMLGFVGKGPEKLVWVRHLNMHDAELPVDLNSGMYSLYLYSDIVEDQLIGDVFAPHRTLERQGERRGTSSLTPTRIRILSR